MDMQRRVVLAARPEGIPQAEHFRIEEADVPSLGDGQFLVRNEYLSVDPAMRGWVSAEGNYAEPVAIGSVMRSFAAGTVIESRRPSVPVGARVMGMFGWQELAVDDGTALRRVVHERDVPLSLSLGILGLNGVTAWFGLTDLGRPRPGDTVVVSTAAGSVGSVVGQLARLSGCRVVGITGGAQKVRLCIDEFGYDAALDYRAASFADDLRAACPSGADVYFDNTAGAISDAVWPLLNRLARVVVCGTASVASWNPIPLGPRPERYILTKSLRVSGMLYFDYEHRAEEAIARLADLVRRGHLRYREDLLEGLEKAPDAIAGLYRGDNLGKRLIHLTAPSTRSVTMDGA